MIGAEFDLWSLLEAAASRVPERTAIIQGERRWTYATLADRSVRLARYLADRGLGLHRERAQLAGYEAGQDRLAQYLYNGPEYLEGLFGSFRARVAPFNVNYRYVADELRYLLNDAAPAAVQYSASFAPQLAAVLPDVPSVRILLQVDDGSGHDLLPGAVDYEQALRSVPPDVHTAPSPDDLYLLYTGGTTGMPKGVLWRQADAAVALTSVRNRRAGREWASLEEKSAAITTRPQHVLHLAPYMHGGGQWNAMQTLFDGNTLVITNSVSRFDPADALDTISRTEVAVFTLVGDAFAGPLADELERRHRSLPSVRFMFSGGAGLSARNRQRLLAAIPGLKIMETVGSTEAGVQGAVFTTADGARPLFRRIPGTLVVSEDLTSVLRPGHDGLGWLATEGRIPLGYLGDQVKTERTFPVVEGRRLAVPGDRARLLAGDLVDLVGREAVTINSGGEKIFGEEVEEAVKSHPDVVDCVVCGRPSDRWGAEVTALVSLRPGAPATAEELIDHCAARLARYKLPKAVVIVEEILRAPSGKPDYRWAQRTAAETAQTG